MCLYLTQHLLDICLLPATWWVWWCNDKCFLVFHHCAGIAAPGAPANKANSLLIAYNPLQPMSKIISNFYHVLIEPGILSKAVTLAALPSRLQPPFPLRMPISSALRTSCTCPHEHSPMLCSSHFFQTCTQETVLFKTLLLSIAAIIC